MQENPSIANNWSRNKILITGIDNRGHKLCSGKIWAWNNRKYRKYDEKTVNVVGLSRKTIIFWLFKFNLLYRNLSIWSKLTYETEVRFTIFILVKTARKLVQPIRHKFLVKIKWENPIVINLGHPLKNVGHPGRPTLKLAPCGEKRNLVPATWSWFSMAKSSLFIFLFTRQVIDRFWWNKFY